MNQTLKLNKRNKKIKKRIHKKNIYMERAPDLKFISLALTFKKHEIEIDVLA